MPTSTLSKETECSKWQPKFACLSKLDKLMLLYDYEPSNNVILANLSTLATSSLVASTSQMATTTTYRLDNGMKRDLFFNYWKARLNRFEPSLMFSSATTSTSSYHLAEAQLKTDVDQNFMNDGISYAGNHHLSNRDIGI